MINTPIKNTGITSLPAGALPTPSSLKPSAPFANTLKDAVTETARLQREADASALKALSGESKSLHETMIAFEKADISFRTMLQMRNRVLEAYQEIMRMQV